MNRSTIDVTELLREPYLSPKVTVVRMTQAEIICTSGTPEAYSEEDTENWYK